MLPAPPAPARRSVGHRAFLLPAALTLAAAFLAQATPAQAAGVTAEVSVLSESLRQHAAARGKFIGAALATNPLANESAYRTIAAGEFNQVTAENAMKWESIQPNQGQFNWSGADTIVNFAQQNGQKVHGHTLVWHSQTPNCHPHGRHRELRVQRHLLGCQPRTHSVHPQRCVLHRRVTSVA
jgi:GH35 family endo-1,4-beta-xylanase